MVGIRGILVPGEKRKREESKTYLSLVAVSRVDIVENVDVNVIQDNTVRIGSASSIVEDVPKYDSSFSR